MIRKMILALSLILLISSPGLPQEQTTTSGTEPPSFAFVPYRADDPTVGPKFAKVTIVEFSDFQCPHCGDVEPKLKRILESYPGEVKLIFKHQPLPRHENALQAAEAAEAAREQGKFWQMHDILYANQEYLGPSKYEKWGKKIGLDLTQFRQSMKEHRNLKRIREDAQLQDSTGARGTPTFFINGRVLQGNLPYEEFQTLVADEIRNADELLKNGNALDETFYENILRANSKLAKSQTQTSLP